jgi:hypothetical protein
MEEVLLPAAEDTRMTTHDRRGGVEFELPAPIPATLVFRLRGEEVELDAKVVKTTANTLGLELASGAGTLALATARRCEVVMELGGREVRALGRPGRRVGDIPFNTQIEVVLAAGLELPELLGLVDSA